VGRREAAKMMDFSSFLARTEFLALEWKLKRSLSLPLRVVKSLQAKEIALFAQGSGNF
jgi:hypothetical protein